MNKTLEQLGFIQKNAIVDFIQLYCNPKMDVYLFLHKKGYIAISYKVDGYYQPLLQMSKDMYDAVVVCNCEVKNSENEKVDREILDAAANRMKELGWWVQ